MEEQSTPRPVAIGQLLEDATNSGQGFQAEVEGTVTLVSRHLNGFQLELSSETARMRVNVTNGSGLSPRLLLNSRVKCVGVCHGAWAPDGRLVVGVLDVPSFKEIQILELAPELWNVYPTIAISNLLRPDFPSNSETIVHLTGVVAATGQGFIQLIGDGKEQLKVRLTQDFTADVDSRVEMLGNRIREGTNIILICRFWREMPAHGRPGQLSLLTTASQIKLLTREESLRKYPVRIRGVITCIDPRYQGIVIQDSTLGIYVKNCHFPPSGPARVGEYWEVEGVTDAGFAPMVQPQKLTRLGEGILPEPVHPTWDQLMNGSLDTQYAELYGIVSSVQPESIKLLTPSGLIQVRLPGLDQNTLRTYENALVRLRGCLFAIHENEKVTLKVRVGEVEVRDPLITVVEPPPANLFAIPRKPAAELLFFDPKASAFQRVKVAGQIVQIYNGVYYLLDGATGLRFIPNGTTSVEIGDQVEIVGYPDLTGISPVMLREAVVRKLGHTALPSPIKVTSQNLLHNEHDATLVQIEAALEDFANSGAGTVLEMQAGTQKFVAHLADMATPLKPIPIGSKLELTGVYAGQGGGNRTANRDFESFELLLNSPADIKILARPPWWTFQRLLATVGVLVAILALAVIWISLLRRQVEQRTTQLKREIQEREHAEYKHALELERSRIARDLHDDIGSSLTEISMLAESSPDEPPAEMLRKRFDKILNRAQAVVCTLDEIVWAVDPCEDTLSSLVHYLAGFAEEYVSAANLSCRIEVPDRIPDIPLSIRERHHLFLAVKEALNNAVRHSDAGEVVFRMTIAANNLNLTITDNGQGFDPASQAKGNGLANLNQRLADMNGKCEINSGSGAGTTVSLTLPLSQAHKFS